MSRVALGILIASVVALIVVTALTWHKDAMRHGRHEPLTCPPGQHPVLIHPKWDSGGPVYACSSP